MQWDDLQSFLAIARHGTLSAAARALGVSQPTMGRRLAAMEAETSARLLLRTPDGFVLTPLGEQVLQRAERMEQEVLATERLISGSDVRLEGVVRVTTVDTLATEFVTPALLDLQRLHPGIQFEIVPATQSLSLSRREADIAIRMRRFEGDLVIARKLVSMAHGFYVARDRPELAEQGTRQVIAVLDDQAHLPEAKWLAEHFPAARVALRSNSREVQWEAARAGGGVAVLPRFRGDRDPTLRRLLPHLPDLRREVWMGIHADLHRSPRMRATMDALIETFRQHARLFDPDA